MWVKLYHRGSSLLSDSKKRKERLVETMDHCINSIADENVERK